MDDLIMQIDKFLGLDWTISLTRKRSSFVLKAVALYKTNLTVKRN